MRWVCLTFSQHCGKIKQTFTAAVLKKSALLPPPYRKNSENMQRLSAPPEIGEPGQEQTRAMGSDRAKNARGMGAAGVAKAACGGVGPSPRRTDGPSKRCGYPSDGLGQADGVQRGHGAAGCA